VQVPRRLQAHPD